MSKKQNKKLQTYPLSTSYIYLILHTAKKCLSGFLITEVILYSHIKNVLVAQNQTGKK